jgi:hypothetical protein
MRMVARVLPALTMARGRWSPSTGDTISVLLQPVMAAHGWFSPPSFDGGSWAVVGMRQWWRRWLAVVAGSGGSGRTGGWRTVKWLIVGRGRVAENAVCVRVGCGHGGDRIHSIYVGQLEAVVV